MGFRAFQSHGRLRRQEVAPVPANNAPHINREKIHAAKTQLETDHGRINPSKIQEWALLDIAEQLAAINLNLMHILANIENASPKLK
ncbi:MAG TPA: hypothetical protein VNZ63_11045 [Verrucomicrobiae bacterium]|jgi:hypothetical protein|nr:hypothetical protein [Verrucomicrobiae bacterium]